MTKEQRYYQRILKQTLITIAVIAVLAVVAAPIAWNTYLKTEARLALREAKNVDMAIRISNIDAYSKNDTIFDDSQADGVAKGYIDEIKHYADVTGTLRIMRWDTANHRVLEFEYKTDHYIVHYEYGGENKDPVWTIDYYRTILNY